jgi:hypothetical protein
MSAKILRDDLVYNSLPLVLDGGPEIRNRNRLIAAVADFPGLPPIRVVLEAAPAVPVPADTQLDVTKFLMAGTADIRGMY